MRPPEFFNEGTVKSHFLSQDMVLCRRYRGLEKRITEDGEKDGLACQVKYWAGAWEVEEIFGQL